VAVPERQSPRVRCDPSDGDTPATRGQALFSICSRTDNAPVAEPLHRSGVIGAMEPGTAVEVWNRSLGCFTAGFQLAEWTPQGWRIRRLSDGAILPVEFSAGDLRPCHSGRDDARSLVPVAISG